MNVQIIKQTDAVDELSKFEGDYITITTYGQGLVSWGKQELNGILFDVNELSSPNKAHLDEPELHFDLFIDNNMNTFVSNGWQYSYLIVDNGKRKLFVENDNSSFTHDEVYELINK